MKREVGNWVEGDRFWDREQEIADLIEHLEEDAHVLLVAQRRIGKTSLMHETARRLKDRYACLLVDVQKCQTPGETITEIGAATRGHLKLWDQTKQVFENALGSAAAKIDSLNIHEVTIKLRDAVSADWQTKGSELMAALAACGHPVALFIDELPILVNRLLKGEDHRTSPERLREAEAFLSWLRTMTMAHKGRLRFVVTGSIGLEPILHQAGLSATINTFTPFELRPWDGPTAIGCLEALATEYNVEFLDGSLEQIVRLLGWCVPHHVQLFFSHVYQDCKRRAARYCSVEDVDRVYRVSMLGTRGHAELLHLEERLKMVLGLDLLPLALELLTEAAVVGILTEPAAEALLKDLRPADDGRESLREILAIFEHDGYLRRVDGGYAFESNLLRDWWSARFQIGFVPSAKRGG